MADTPRVTVPVRLTEAMRLVPDRVLTETLYWMARAYERVHSMPRVSDTELANKIEAAKADLGRARDASPVLSNSAAPAPEGGAVSEAELRDAITLILPMAKGYAAAHPVGSNQSYVDYVEGLIAAREVASAEAGERRQLDRLFYAGGEYVRADEAVRQISALQAELSALRTQPQAREDAQPVARKHTNKCWGKTSYSDEMAHCYCPKEASLQPVGWTNQLGIDHARKHPKEASWMWGLPNRTINIALYTHPAPDALRDALTSIREQIATADDAEHHTLGLIEKIALAALQAEQKGGA